MTATTSLIDPEPLRAEAPNGISYAYRRFGNHAAGDEETAAEAASETVAFLSD